MSQWEMQMIFRSSTVCYLKFASSSLFYQQKQQREMPKKYTQSNRFICQSKTNSRVRDFTGILLYSCWGGPSVLTPDIPFEFQQSAKPEVEVSSSAIPVL